MTKAGLSLGVGSVRASQFALEAAKTLAALRGLSEVGQDEVLDASRLVYTPSKRMHINPEMDHADQDSEENQDEQNQDTESQSDDTQNDSESPDQPNQEQPSNEELEDLIVEAVKASIPPQLLRQPKQNLPAGKSAAHISGKSGATQKNFLSGRPLTSRKGRPQDGRRLDILKSIGQPYPGSGFGG
jgi:magnesium chelatase subunit D